MCVRFVVCLCHLVLFVCFVVVLFLSGVICAVFVGQCSLCVVSSFGSVSVFICVLSFVLSLLTLRIVIRLLFLACLLFCLVFLVYFSFCCLCEWLFFCLLCVCFVLLVFVCICHVFCACFLFSFFSFMLRLPPRSSLFPYVTFFRSFSGIHFCSIGVSNLLCRFLLGCVP